MSRQGSKTNYGALHNPEVIFIGSELGLLAAAALLARRGVRVSVLEGRSRTVEEESVLSKEGFTFEYEPAAFGGFHADGPAYRILRESGIEMRAQRMDPAAEVVVADHRIKVYGDNEKLAFELWREFPDDIWRINKFLASLERLEERLWQAGRTRPIPLPLSLRDRVKTWQDLNYRYLRLWPYLNRTLEEHRNRYVKDEGFARIINLLTLTFGRVGLDHCSLPYAANVLMLGKRGFYYLYGGRRGLASRLIESIRENEGDIRFNCRIERIITSGNRALGLRLEDGEVINAPYIVVANSEREVCLRKTKLPSLAADGPAEAKMQGRPVLCLGVDGDAIEGDAEGRLILVDGGGPDPALAVFLAPADDSTSSPDGKRALTILSFPPSGPNQDEDHPTHDDVGKILSRLGKIWPKIEKKALLIGAYDSSPLWENIDETDIGPSGHHSLIKKTPVDNILALESSIPFGWGGSSAFTSSLYLANFLTEKLSIKNRIPLKIIKGS